MNDRIYVAKLGKAVGLKGHVRLFMDTDFPEQFKKGARFVTNKNLNLVVEEYLPKRDIIRFEGFDNMDLAKRLTNQELYVTQDDTRKQCQLKDNEYFWFDIVDCTITEDGICLGIVKELHRYPTDDYLEVQTSNELVSKNLPKTFLIPYNLEQYILKVDIDNKTIFTKNAFDILENS